MFSISGAAAAVLAAGAAEPEFNKLAVGAVGASVSKAVAAEDFRAVDLVAVDSVAVTESLQ